MRKEIAAGLGVFLVLGTIWSQVAAAVDNVARAGSTSPSNRTQEKDREYFTDTVLLNRHGRQLRFYSDVLDGRTVLINTIYTNCPGACPLMIGKLKEVRALLSPATRDKILFVSISVDPLRDSARAMRDFAANMDLPGPDRWLLLTGEKTDIDLVLTRLGQYTDDYREHSSLVLAGNVPARRWSKIAPHMPPRSIAARLEQLFGDN